MIITWVDDLPVMRIKARDFFKLPEYSATIPTGVTIGKRWRCLLGSHDFDFRKRGGKPRWIIREYVKDEKDSTMAVVKQYRPVIIAERSHG